MKMRVVEALPTGAERSRRESALAEVVELARRASPQFVEVTDESPADVTKLYKSMIQYRIRHPELGIQLRKQGDRFFVWIEAPREESPPETADATTPRRQGRNTKKEMAPKAAGASALPVRGG